MSRTPCPVETCDRPMPGSRVICGACEADIARALNAVPGLTADLDVTLARQTSRTTVGRSAVVPLPFDPRASEAAWVLRSALAGWVRQLQEHRPEPWPADTPQDMAAWLSARLQRLVRHPAAPEAHGEITEAVRAAQRVVDRPQERRFAGYCDCGAALYARPGAATVRCRHCDADPYQVATLREQMLQQAEDVLATATEIARAVTRLGHPVTPAA
ncbi:MAG TPA: hypothetical protein VF158_04790, partial [Longimicrobiales bacterium]